MVAHAHDPILDRPLCKLRLRIEGAPLAARIARLQRELERRGLRLRPHTWLSTDFFSPDGVPGIGIPFYLADASLLRLERRQMLHAEGASERECMGLLRHEAGHAIDTAFELHRRADWRAAFGRRSQPYRRTFELRPASLDFVRHLPNWYAQSHPAEDFAETFAVWLAARSGARVRGLNACSQAKLELVQRIMDEIAGKKPTIHSRERPFALSQSKETLAQYYRRKQRHTLADRALPFEHEFADLFGPDGPRTTRSPAAAWLRSRRRAIEARVRGPHRGDAYSIQQILEHMLRTCAERGLRLNPEARAPTLARVASLLELTLQTLQLGQAKLCR